MGIEFRPGHPNANIHGVVNADGSATCFTRDGKTMCTGCCTGLRIEENGKLAKDEGSNCQAQLPGNGCLYVLQGQPSKRFSVCGVYHCSSDRAKAAKRDMHATQRITIINIATLHNGEVSQTTFQENLSRVG